MHTATPTAEQKMRFAVARFIAKKRAPYLRSLLYSFETFWTRDVPTAACTKTGVLLLNPDFADACTDEEYAGVLAHECAHRFLRHHERRGTRDGEKFNRAGDRAGNTMVLSMGFRLPAGCLLPKDIGAPDGLTTDEYYALEPDLHEPGWQCGSCCGNPLVGEPEGARSEAENARVLRATAEEIRDAAARSPGSVPAGLARVTEDLLGTPVVPWTEKLYRFTNRGLARRPGASTYAWDRMSRRQAGLGFGAGVPILPASVSTTPRVDVILDASASMGNAEITDSVIEAGAIIAATGAAIRAAVCDAEVHGLKSVASVHELAAMLKGGGGTDMRPAFAALRKLSPPSELVVCFTDGWIGDPGPEPDAHTIWVVVGEHANPKPAPWGDVVIVNRKVQAA